MHGCTNLSKYPPLADGIMHIFPFPNSNFSSKTQYMTNVIPRWHDFPLLTASTIHFFFIMTAEESFRKRAWMYDGINKLRPGAANVPTPKLSRICQYITKTYLCNFDPLKPHFYIVKLGFTRVYIIFLISAQNIDCGYSLEPSWWGSFNEYTQSMFCAEIWKISEFFIGKFSVFGNKIFYLFE